MSGQILAEDLIVFLALCLIVLKSGQSLFGKTNISDRTKLKSMVWRFRCFSIILLIYLMMVGMLHQLGILATFPAMILWAVVIVPLWVVRKWFFRHWVLRE